MSPKPCNPGKFSLLVTIHSVTLISDFAGLSNGRSRMTIVKRFLASGFWLMLLAALVFSVADILTKYLTTLFSAMEIAFVRSLLEGSSFGPSSLQEAYLSGETERAPYFERPLWNPVLLLSSQIHRHDSFIQCHRSLLHLSSLRRPSSPFFFSKHR